MSRRAPQVEAEAASSAPGHIMYATARSRRVSETVMRALFLIGRAENDWNVNSCNSSGHCGVFQLNYDWQRRHDYRDVAYWTNYAIDHGFYGYGGLNHIAATHPSWSIGEMVQACQGAGPTFAAAAAYYNSRLSQSDADLRSVAGSVSAPTPSRPKYVNPLAQARVRAERIDQGVDYAGTGYLLAIADANISSVFPGGWNPYGNYMEYKITTPGSLDGAYVYYAEGIEPLVKYGQHVKAGDRIARLIPGWRYGIEIGFAAGDGHAHTYYAYHDGHYSEGTATRPGIAFSNLVKRLGGPGGVIEGEVVGRFPEYAQSGEPGGDVSASAQTGGSIGAGGPAFNAPGAAAAYGWPGAYYSAFVQLQRGIGTGAHHANSAWFYAGGVIYKPAALPKGSK